MKKGMMMLWIVFILKGLHSEKLLVWVEKGNGSVYSPSERISINVLPHISGYLYVYNIDAEGHVHILFPKNGIKNYVNAGRIYRLPYDFGLDVEWVAGENPGIEYVYAFITPYPIPYISETRFVPLSPDEYYYDDGILICYRFFPPHFFPRIYFYGWAYFYVRPYYYVYHPIPWYCYDCHHPRILFYFCFDFCPIYIIEFDDCCTYTCYPRYYKTYRYKYRIRPIYREISPKKVREYKEIEKKYKNYDKPPLWETSNPLKERKEDLYEKEVIKEKSIPSIQNPYKEQKERKFEKNYEFYKEDRKNIVEKDENRSYNYKALKNKKR